ELATRSDDFRVRWAAHDVRHHRTGLKRIRHPEVGDLELGYEAMEFPAHPDWFMFGYTAARRAERGAAASAGQPCAGGGHGRREPVGDRRSDHHRLTGADRRGAQAVTDSSAAGRAASRFASGIMPSPSTVSTAQIAKMPR